jgi:hypothetical protein
MFAAFNYARLSLQEDACNYSTPKYNNPNFPQYCRKSGRLVLCYHNIRYCTSHGGWDQGSVCTSERRLTVPLDVHLELTKTAQLLPESASSVEMLLPGGRHQGWCEGIGCTDKAEVCVGIK